MYVDARQGFVTSLYQFVLGRQHCLCCVRVRASPASTWGSYKADDALLVEAPRRFKFRK